MSRMLDIIKAMRSPGNIVAPSLRGYSPVKTGNDILCASGAYCLVFPLLGKYDSTPSRCLRLWFASDTDLREIVSEAERLSSLLPDPSNPYLCEMRFHREALRLPDGTILPGLEMPYIARSLEELICSDDKPSSYEYRAMANNMMKLSSAMKEAGISHGDLSTANIMVGADLGLTLIDFDFLLWPSKGIKCRRQIIGAPDYNRGDRSENPRSLSDDHFAEQLIHLMLLAFSKNPLLNTAEEIGEASLFDASDLESPSSFRASEGYMVLWNMHDNEIVHYLNRLYDALSCPYSKIPPLCEVALSPARRQVPSSPMQEAEFCHECGNRYRFRSWSFCPECGTRRRMVPAYTV